MMIAAGVIFLAAIGAIAVFSLFRTREFAAWLLVLVRNSPEWMRTGVSQRFMASRYQIWNLRFVGMIAAAMCILFLIALTMRLLSGS
jgi:hypothetical protein